MTDYDYTEKLRKLVADHPTQYGKLLHRQENKDLLEFINSYEFEKLKDHNIKTKIYWILNGIHDFPKCNNPACTNPVTSNVRNIRIGYGTDYPTCCSSCAKKTPQYLKNFGDSLEKHFGVRHQMQSQEVKDKVRNTSLERWGGIGFASKEINAKERQIFIEKYGTDNPGDLPESRATAKQTSIEHWGVDNPMKCKEIQLKVKATTIKNHGEKMLMGGVGFIEKTKQTKLERYGDENYNNSAQIVKTQLAKYGALWGNRSNQAYNTSKGEKEVVNFVRSIYDGLIVENDRTILTPSPSNNWKMNHELDIWIPDLKMGIEYNGVYWHSLKNTVESDKMKMQRCVELGIRLIIIPELDWKQHNDDVKLFLQKEMGFV